MAISDSRRVSKPARQPARSSAPPPGLNPSLRRRVIVDNVRPQVDCGRFPIKRTVGEVITVTADVYADGHDQLGAALLYRQAGDPDWTELPMAFVDNDRCEGTFVVDALGLYEYTVE